MRPMTKPQVEMAKAGPESGSNESRSAVERE